MWLEFKIVWCPSYPLCCLKQLLFYQRFFKKLFYRIKSNTVYIKAHFINSHISTSMYLVYRCDWSSGTKNLKDLEDHGDQYNRCFYVYLAFMKKEWASSHTPRSNIAWECCIQWMAIPSIRDGQSDKKGDINCSSKGSNQHFL